MTPDLARDGLANLQQRMLRATVAARTPADLVAVQRDLVEGARRLVEALEQARRATTSSRQAARLSEAWTDAVQFHRDAQAALARYEQAAALEAGE